MELLNALQVDVEDAPLWGKGFEGREGRTVAAFSTAHLKAIGLKLQDKL